MNYRYLLIDNDDTLMDFTRSEYECIGRSLQALRLPDSNEIRRRYARINQGCWKDFEKGLLPREQIPIRRFAKLLESLDRPPEPELIRRLAQTYENELAHSAILLPGAETFLGRAAKRLCICILTNGNTKIQTSRFALSGLDRLANNIFISEALGVRKPQKEFFETVFCKTGITDPSLALTVGDSLSSDIAGGIAAGTATCLFDPGRRYSGGAIRPDFVAHSFPELETLLGI